MFHTLWNISCRPLRSGFLSEPLEIYYKLIFRVRERTEWEEESCSVYLRNICCMLDTVFLHWRDEYLTGRPVYTVRTTVPDLWNFDMDPDTRIRILLLCPVAFLMPTKNKLLLITYSYFNCRFSKTTSFPDVKKCRSKDFLNFIKVFLHIFACWWKDPDVELIRRTKNMRILRIQIRSTVFFWRNGPFVNY